MDTKPGKRSNYPSIFISYSHVDEGWKNRLVKQLRVLEPEENFEVWDDRRIAPGEDWDSAIEQALAKASVAILLISEDFLTSSFILSKEVPCLLKRRQEEGLRVIPLIVWPCAWDRVKWLKGIQSRPVDGRPLAEGSDYQIRQDLADLVAEVDVLLNELFTVPYATFVELKSLLQQTDVSEGTVRRVFHTYLKTLGELASWELPDLSTRPLWDCLFDYLLDPSWMKSSGQHHLINFISRLAPQANSVSQRCALQAWARKTAAELGISRPEIPPEPSFQDESQPYLLLGISPEGNYYSLRAWFTDSSGVFDDISEKRLGSNLDDLPERLKEVLDNPKVIDARLGGNAPILEFFLPVNLLNRDLDQWTPSRENPLSAQFGLVVRAGERLWGKHWLTDWGRTWQALCQAVGEKASRRRTAWLTCSEDSRRCGKHLRNGRCVIGLWFIPSTACFETLFASGVCVLLWSRVDMERAAQDRLKRQISRQVIRSLPEWLRKQRADYWENSQQTGPLSLLWDDPERLPDNYEPMESHPDF